MGWKSLKERFGITHHVQVNGNLIFIGSGYVHDLAAIDSLTGRVAGNSTFKSFLPENYPNLLAASSEEIKSLLKAPDTFSQSITVYTYDGGKIIEKLCE